MIWDFAGILLYMNRTTYTFIYDGKITVWMPVLMQLKTARHFKAQQQQQLMIIFGEKAVKR